jgi:hypothetical protein
MLGALGLGLPQRTALASAGRRERAVILLWLWGGPPHLDTFDPKPEVPSEWRGPYRALTTPVAGIQVTELLPKLAQRTPSFSLIRSLHHSTTDHGLAGAVQLTGRAPLNGRVHPNAGSVVARLREDRTPLSPFVVVGEPLRQGHRLIPGEGGGALGAVYDPFRVRYEPGAGVQLGEVEPPAEVGSARALRRRGLLRRIAPPSAMEPDSHWTAREAVAVDRYYAQAFDLMTRSDGRRVFELDREPTALRDRFGRHRFGQSCLLARRLVEAGVRFVQVNWSQHVEAEEDAGDGGWDNHYRNFEMLADRQAWPFDQGCAALLDDLRERGLLHTTLVVAVGEFGRSPRINPQAGRDHWPACYSALLAGGGVEGGRVVGASDARGEAPSERPVSPEDLTATMLESLGITRTELLTLGLPMEGEPVRELF